MRKRPSARRRIDGGAELLEVTMPTGICDGIGVGGNKKVCATCIQMTNGKIIRLYEISAATILSSSAINTNTSVAQMAVGAGVAAALAEVGVAAVVVGMAMIVRMGCKIVISSSSGSTGCSHSSSRSRSSTDVGDSGDHTSHNTSSKAGSSAIMGMRSSSSSSSSSSAGSIATATAFMGKSIHRCRMQAARGVVVAAAALQRLLNTLGSLRLIRSTHTNSSAHTNSSTHCSIRSSSCQSQRCRHLQNPVGTTKVFGKKGILK